MFLYHKTRDQAFRENAVSAMPLVRILSCIPSAAIHIALISACAAAYAQDKAGDAADATLQKITVTATLDPVEKSYRKMIKGMDLFEKKHGMAPDAALRFKLLPRRRGTNMDRIVLEILGDSVVIPVPVASDHTFAIERNQKALDEDASVTPNRRAQSMTWRTEIRTPGLPPNTRRLGDLRLECQVGIEADLVSNVRPIFGQIAKLISGMLDFCNSGETEYFFFSDRPLFSVAMVAGARREILPVDRLYAGVSRHPEFMADLSNYDCEALLDRTYFLPLADRSWPDDTLVEFEYMDDNNVPQAR